MYSSVFIKIGTVYIFSDKLKVLNSMYGVGLREKK